MDPKKVLNLNESSNAALVEAQAVGRVRVEIRRRRKSPAMTGKSKISESLDCAFPPGVEPVVIGAATGSLADRAAATSFKSRDTTGHGQIARTRAAKRAPVPCFDDLPDAAHVDVRVVATLYGCKVPTIWARLRRNAIPAPRRFGAHTRWNVGDLRKALKEQQ